MKIWRSEIFSRIVELSGGSNEGATAPICDPLQKKKTERRGLLSGRA